MRLTRIEETSLAHRYLKGDLKAKDRLIESNLDMVYRVAQEYTGHGLEYDDLVQEGSIGLIRAVENFEPGHPYRLFTYSIFWVRQYVLHALNRASPTKIPLAVAKRRKLIDEMILENPKISIDELSVFLKCSTRNVRDALEAGKVVTSLDIDRDTVKESLPLPKEEKEEDDTVVISLDHLPDIERQVLEYRFGFYGNPMTKEGVAKMLGLEFHEVTPLETKALATLEKLWS